MTLSIELTPGVELAFESAGASIRPKTSKALVVAMIKI